jgi:DNA-binding CsgD family transcriptional regulator
MSSLAGVAAQDPLVTRVIENCGAGSHSLVSGPSLSGRSRVAATIATRVDGALLIAGLPELRTISYGAFALDLCGTDPLDRLATTSSWLAAQTALVVDDPHLLDEMSIAALSLASASVPVVLVVHRDAVIPPGAARIAATASGGQLDIEPLTKDAVHETLDRSPIAINPMAKWQGVEFAKGRPGIVSYLVDRAERDGSWDFLVPDIEPDRLLLDLVSTSYGVEELKTLAVLGVVHRLPIRMLEQSVGALVLERARGELNVDDSGIARASSDLIATCARQLVDTEWLADAISRLDHVELDAYARLACADVCRTDPDDDTVLAAADEAARLHRRRTALALVARANLQCPERTHRAALVYERLDRWSELADLLGPWRKAELAPTRRARWAAMMATAVFFDEQNDGPAQIAAAEDVLVSWDLDPAARVELVVERANMLWHCGRIEEALEAVHSLGSDLDPALRVRTFGIVATRRLALGDTDWVGEQAMALLPTALMMGDAAAQSVVRFLIVVLVFEFRFDEAERLLQLAEGSMAPGALGERADMLGVRAAIAAVQGRPHDALTAVDEAIDIAHYCGDATTLVLLGALGVHAALSTASTVSTERYVALMDNQRSSRLAVAYLQSDVEKCALRASDGDRKGAIGEMLSAAQAARVAGLVGEEIRRMHGAVCLGATTSLRSQRMHSLKREVRSPVLRLMIDRIVATERADPFGLMEVSKRLHEKGAMIDAVECALQASAAAQQAGRLDYATECDLKALALLALIPGTDSPLMRMLRGTDNRFKLTAREREIVGMAQKGMTNKQIAGAMFVGVRTVEGHLLRSYAKLGIKSRSELQQSNA